MVVNRLSSITRLIGFFVSRFNRDTRDAEETMCGVVSSERTDVDSQTN